MTKTADPGLMAYFRAGPVNWAPRFDAELLEAAGFRLFLRYLENNPVRACLAKQARKYKWSSAAAHCAGTDDDGLLCLTEWQNLFAKPAQIAEDWRNHLEERIAEEARNEARLASIGYSYNRPKTWRRPEAAETASMRAG